MRCSFVLVSSRAILLATAVPNDRDYNCNHCQVDEETQKRMDAENNLSRDVVFGRTLEAISRDIRRNTRVGNAQVVVESRRHLLQFVVVVKFYQKCHRGSKYEAKIGNSAFRKL